MSETPWVNEDNAAENAKLIVEQDPRIGVEFNARGEVLKLLPAMEAVGLPEEWQKAIADKRVDESLARYEALQAADPLQIMKGLLSELASCGMDDDRKSIEHFAQRAEDVREKWRKIVLNEKDKAEMSSQAEPDMKSIVAGVPSAIRPSFVEYDSATGNIYPMIDVAGAFQDSSGRVVDLSNNLVQDFLYKIGALKQGRELDILTNLPGGRTDISSWDQPWQSGSDRHFIHSLPTTMPGVKENVDIGQHPRIMLSFNMDAFSKLVALPSAGI